MKDVILTLDSLQLDGHTISLGRRPIVSLGVDKQWIDAHFVGPKVWAFVKERAQAEGYDKVAENGVSYFFFHERKGIYGEGSRQVACSDLIAQMPTLPNYTKFLGLDLEEADLNKKLKMSIDGLGLDQLETIIMETGFVGPSRREARFGPSGVIIAMSDEYTINVRY